MTWLGRVMLFVETTSILWSAKKTRWRSWSGWYRAFVKNVV